MSVPSAFFRRRHTPERTCAGCGTRAPRVELLRFGLSADGGLEWRATGGRGSYLHRAEACARVFARQKKVVPGLRRRIAREPREALLATGGRF